MSWQQWTLVAYYAFAAMSSAYVSGRPRTPTWPTGGMLVAQIALAMILCALVVTA